MYNTKEKLTDAVVMDGIIFLMGMVLLTQFFALLFQGIFTPTGLTTLLSDIGHYLDEGSYAKKMVWLLLQYKTVLAPLFGLLLFFSAVCSTMLMARATVSLLVGLAFFLSWIILWRYPGMWSFEFFFPASFAVCAGLSKLTSPVLTSSLFHKLAWSKSISIAMIMVMAMVLWYVTFIAYHDTVLATKISISSAITFFVLSLFHLGIDNLISKKNDDVSCDSRWPWIDIIIITIGAMMVMQVYANYYSGLFEVNNYRSLVNYYASASGSDWLRPFLVWSAEHSDLLMPLQIIFEVVVAILLCLLILSGPVLLLTAGLFIILAFSELGVSASWPPNPDNLTWEWELLLVTGVSLLIGYRKLIELLHADNRRQAIFGKKIFNKLSLMMRLLIAVAGGTSLYFIGIATKIFGDTYEIISLSAGVTFFLLLAVLAFLDKYRA